MPLILKAILWRFAHACKPVLCGLICALSAEAQPTISGRVINANTGFGIVGIDLDVFDQEGNAVSIIGGKTGAEGHYSVMLPHEGSFLIRADPSSADFFVDQYYPKVFLRSQAVILSVGPDSTVTGIDFRLTSGFLIRGVVEASGAPLAGIDLDLYASNGEFLSGYPGISSTTGTFVIGSLPPGEYFLRATPSAELGQYYVPAYVGGAYERSAAIPLIIDSSDLNSTTIDLKPGGTIAGRVYARDTLVGIENIDLDTFDAAGRLLVYSVRTDSVGGFVLGPIPPGEYKVRADPSEEQNFIRLYFPGTPFRADAEVIQVLAGQETGNVEFALAPAGSIAGQVLAADTGVPISGVKVNLFDSSGRLLDVAARSDASGFYRLHPVPVGFGFVGVEVDARSGFAAQFYSEAGTIADATPLQVDLGQITKADFRLNSAGWIEGVVKNMGGDPLAGIDLDLYRSADGERVSVTTLTREDGSYLLGPVLPGSYLLRCDPAQSQSYARTYFPNSFFVSSADTIVVSAAQGATANFFLSGAGGISGRITDLGTNVGVEGVDLDIYDATGQALDVTALSDPTGYYLLAPVPVGSYYIRAQPHRTAGRKEEFFENASDLSGATAIVVIAGTTSSDNNFDLAPAGWIEGTVSNTIGTALPGIDLDLYFAETGERVKLGSQTDASGGFQIGPLEPGAYLLRCDPTIADGYAVEYYSGKTTKALSDSIQIEAFSGTSIDFILDPAGSLSGRVLAADSGEALAGVDLDILEAFTLTRFDQSTRTDALGFFSIGPLPLGDYFLRADPISVPGYTRTYFPASTSLSGAEAITLTTAGVLGNLQIQVIPSQPAAVSLISVREGTTALRIQANAPESGVLRLECLPSLSSLTWAPVGIEPSISTGIATWIVPLSSSNQFFRANIE